MTGRDLINGIEKAVVATLKKATTQTPAGHRLQYLHGPDGPDVLADNIHTKIRRDGNGDPAYADHELPAIGVYCLGKPEEDLETMGEVGLDFPVVLDVVVRGGDMGDADEKMKRIMGDIDLYFRHFRADPTIEDTGDGITSLSPSRLITIGDSVAHPVYTGDIQYQPEGMISISIEVSVDG